MTHLCPRCGKQTDGAWSEGGFKWAICLQCMAEEIEDREEFRDMMQYAYAQHKTEQITQDLREQEQDFNAFDYEFDGHFKE
jgi:hypothetical protein